MTERDLEKIVQQIVAEAVRLRDAFTNQRGSVTYVCIFCRNEKEFTELQNVALENGGIVAKSSEAGPYIVVSGIETAAGKVRVVRPRRPDPTKSVRGDADFMAQNYDELKTKSIGQDGFKLIKRDDFEMIELVKLDYNAWVYFSDPPVTEFDGIRQALAKVQ